MKLRPVSVHAPHLHPLRFGRVWRGHELILRLIQIAVLLFVAVAGGRLVAHALAVGGSALAAMFA